MREIIVFFLLYHILVSGGDNKHLINQHECQVQGNYKLVCKYDGEREYRTDRLLKEVKVVVFREFGLGSIIINPNHLPNMETVEIVHSFVDRNQLCMSVHAQDTDIIVDGEKCQELMTSTVDFETSSSTYDKIFASATIIIEKRKHQTESPQSSTKMQVLVIVTTVLSVLLVVILLSWIKTKIVRLLEQRYQQSVYRSTFSGLSFSERMRARRAEVSRQKQNRTEV